MRITISIIADLISTNIHFTKGILSGVCDLTHIALSVNSHCAYRFISGQYIPTIFQYLLAERPYCRHFMSSFESKKIVHCGLCNFKARRDVMKTRNFPMVHRGNFNKMWTSNHQLPPLPDLPPKEAADEEIINEKKDTAEEKVEIEERWACSLASAVILQLRWHHLRKLCTISTM